MTERELHRPAGCTELHLSYLDWLNTQGKHILRAAPNLASIYGLKIETARRYVEYWTAVRNIVVN